jgi:hypothetical protein
MAANEVREQGNPQVSEDQHVTCGETLQVFPVGPDLASHGHHRDRDRTEPA